MFKFQFENEEDDSPQHINQPQIKTTTHDAAPSKRLSPLPSQTPYKGSLLSITPKTQLYQRDVADLRTSMLQSSASSDESWIKDTFNESGSDVILGRYEGGFKTWESSLDLVGVLERIDDAWWSGKNVLELGCGQALPGMYCLIHGAKVTFQDYNEEVLTLLTLPNTILNTSSPSQKPKSITAQSQPPQTASFISGDWLTTPTLLLPNSFDVILTAETVYHAEFHARLFELIKYALKPTGSVYLAAKTNYFGCTGSLPQFRALVAQDGSMEWTTVFAVTETVRREVVKMVFKQ
ncbi:hypothetical protein SmJEL517_g05837 [Synchytrium microbalum]|uniref:protein-histidine N-methyltransferase n=1 Tax=Synchytrium microbalum TaxID=1806994 RepID=A0A507BZ67_9FUNG|nr:uncharacterized protein SmJEL517_g05837 [Synchytrium microbalum]TPX30645.1 hypothetical protein SmJEL517_g05837 [Synchytrium microbalum]